MSTKISKLEQDWLVAGALANEIKAHAKELRHGGEPAVSIRDVKELNAEHPKAERVASEAFDRLWSAGE